MDLTVQPEHVVFVLAQTLDAVCSWGLSLGNTRLLSLESGNDLGFSQSLGTVGGQVVEHFGLTATVLSLFIFLEEAEAANQVV